ncbi:GH32 C-terminal domain-containing protein [Lentzea sp. JNUCC 0626]|uniref:GH32 C-terminal domain-containing protein n=1 Tax=Lentzea sp. JNUCC 0626 TaxID=3367513 RepID=UPI003747BC7C
MKRRDLLRTSAVTGLALSLPPAAATAAAADSAAPRGRKAAPDLVIADFEGTDWNGWTVTGDAFGGGPVHGGQQLLSMDVRGYRGDGIASSERAGDGPIGTVTSPAFTIQRRYISYGVAGGDYEYVTCLNLLVDGQVVRSATGRTSDTFKQGSWDVGEFAGRRAQIQIVDTATGDWGHVLVDHVVQTDEPETPPLLTQPLYRETWRPQVHFTARQWAMERLEPGQRQEGWLNDLNGLVYYEGEYHLFAQRWNKCWIHAVSPDLVHWTELRPAFFEESLGSGVQSGSIVIDYRNTSGLSPNPATPPMVAFWSRNDNRSQCLSYSLDKGRTWKHHPGNPILTMPERDPKVFRYEPGGHWVMFLYGDGAYHILTSPDLLHWTRTGNTIPNSFECPDFFELPLDGNAANKKWVLVQGNGDYTTGRFDGRKFTEETSRARSDTGLNFYATQSWNNTETGDGRRIQAAWMRDGAYPGMPFNQQVTIPCELKLRTIGGTPRLVRTPVKELDLLRRSQKQWYGTLPPGSPLTLSSGRGEFRITARIDVSARASLRFDVFGVPILVTRQTVDAGSGPQPLAEPVTSLDVVIDRTSIEVFANDGEVSISRCYLPSGSAITLSASGGTAELRPVVTQTLASAWK